MVGQGGEKLEPREVQQTKAVVRKLYQHHHHPGEAVKLCVSSSRICPGRVVGLLISTGNNWINFSQLLPCSNDITPTKLSTVSPPPPKY